ncbi:MAG: glycoside hydrolase [Bryobacterales bacterium]|nr:glycoside hydrolase [Bryobacterales bacterium]
MAKIHICFVWHMHQPFYKDLISGEYHLPWTRMHALKDYYGMVKVLEEFPNVHQTFNLVPSMVVQIQEYAEGKALDPFLRAALKPAEELTEDDKQFILRYFFQAHPNKMIRRYPRYGELYDSWQGSGNDFSRARQLLHPQAMRDLQVLSQLAWFDEEFLDNDPDVARLVRKGSGYTLEDQALMGRKQREICGKVIPVYREFAQRGQIEISTTPFYHPILPLLCDSQIAAVAHPGVPLPRPFRYPEDARHQLRTAREFMTKLFGAAPAGLWPSEGSVSDQALALAAEEGFQWAATDNGVLSRTLGHTAGTDETYRTYNWAQEGRSMRMIFRDHYLSDLVGFVYSRMGAGEAAGHFLDRIRENCAPFVHRGEPAMVPVILDGENAWEHFDLNGRPFLRELYRRISESSDMAAVTVSEAHQAIQPRSLSRIFPGSWINANFDVWIGAQEDNHAWELLLDARQTYDRVLASPEGSRLPEEKRKLAYEELLIAEGSDWCWWYGPEHFSDNAPEFDRLYRSHLANVYQALNQPPPDELSRPIMMTSTQADHTPPSSPLTATIDGLNSSYFEWMGAGCYKPDRRQSSMHGAESPLVRVLYGSDQEYLFLRLDFNEIEMGLRIHLTFEAFECDLTLGEPAPEPVTLACQKLVEIRIPLSKTRRSPGDIPRMKLSLWRGALPLDAIPGEGSLELLTADHHEWAI